MTTISATGASGTTATTDAASSALGTLDSNAFLKLLVAQMKYQNPFSPSDPSAMLGQVASYAQVEALQKISAAQASNAALEQARMAGEVIGKRVTGTDALGLETSGIVNSARFTASGPVLVLDTGKEIALTAVETIGVATAPPTPPTTTSATSSTASGTTSTDTSTSTSTSTDTSTSTSPVTGSGDSSSTGAAATARAVVAALASYGGSANVPRLAALTGRA